MPLSEEAFTAIVDAGCPACRSKTLAIETLVTQWLPLLAGEPFGRPSWAYKGEDLVRGTYRIACDGCKREVFAASECPRCGAADGVGRALEEENSFPLPKACASCGGEQLTATAFVPARVIYDGRRADKARARVEPDEAGFHAASVECKVCRFASSRSDGRCALCAAKACSAP